MPPQLARVIGRTRRRLRTQQALEAATSMGLLWVLSATVLVYLLKARLISVEALWAGLALGALAPLLGALLASARRIPAPRVAKQIDSSHALHDRIGSALEFSRVERPTPFMQAQVADALRHAEQVSARVAAPLRRPRELKLLGLLLLILGLVALLRFPGEAAAPPPARPALPGLAVAPEDLEPYRAMVKELQQQARDEQVADASELARELNQLFEQIQRKELSRKELFEKLAELEKRFFEGLEGDFEQLDKRLKKMGQELSKEKLTKETGEALKQPDLTRAQQELKRLAERLKQLDRQQRRKLARSLDRSARQQMDTRDADRQLQQQRRRLRRLNKQQQKNPSDKLARRRLKRERRRLQRLNRQRQRLQRQNRQLQRLNRQMRQAARGLRQNLSPEAAKALQQAARQAGRFANQRNRMRLMKRSQGQLADLKEMLRRLGQGGKQRKGKLRDFYVRAGGKKGKGKGKGKGKKGTLLMPGSGGDQPDLTLLMPGQGQGQQPGQGQQSGMPADGIGHGSDPNLQGQATRLDSRRRATMVRGAEGRGPTTSEVILGAADSGFASRGYRKVYTRYNQVIEDVLKREQVPLGYKYYVKRYFQLIRPR